MRNAMKRYALLFFTLLIWRSISAQSVTITPPVAYINQGESVTLTASGATFYQWSPAAGLSNTEGPTVVASPAVTTTYTVTGYNPSSTELVVNGDFETGNYGFTSSYQYTTNLVPEGTYYVGANANNYHPGFIGLGHGGSGNFMIINGATAPGTNVWTEQIAVSPNTNYAFSTWICNVSVGDPDVVAQLQFSINGVQLGEIFSGINQLNVWEQYYVIWNSGNTTSATITILNQNTQGGGNDFGIDDISFRALEYVADGQCTVYVDPPDIPLPDNITLANCVFFPTATEWSISQPIISSESALTVITPVVGDIDNDGQQEILVPSGYSQMNVFRANGTLKSQFNIAGLNGGQAVGSFALGNVKWTAETNKVIIVLLGNNRYLYAYDSNGTQLWQSNQQFVSYNGEYSPMPTISFADFNHDGWSEIYIGGEIYDAVTGLFLCKATGNKGYAGRTWDTQANPYHTIAHDLYGDPRLELAIGNTVYDVNIQSRTNASLNNVTAISQLSPSEMIMEDNSAIPFTDGNTTVIDINFDGRLDVLVMNVDQSNRVVYLYIWDVYSETIICSKKITNARKFGFPQIGDIDNDGNPEICFIVGTYSDHNTGSNDLIYALKYNPSNSNGAMDIFWTTPHSDNSACTGLTLFDFNQDGYAELVYRDIAQLRIINGSLIHHQSGEPVSQPYDMATFPCCSNTQIEYPIIVDVDLDGEAEIIIGGANSMTDYGHLYIFKSGSTPWAPARKVWNQYMYNVTNVNMDLTIPQYVFNNATPFTDPQGVVRRPFNNFLQQATTIDQYGRPFYAVPDVAALTVNINTSGGNATFNVTYTNQGDNTLNAPYYITVFANQFGGEVVQTITVNTPLPVGGTGQQSIPLPMSVLCQLESLTSLVVVINCNGGGIAQNGGLRPECDITNNMAQASINLQSEPITITETACDQFTWYGQNYTQSGQYETTIPNSYGCDSTLVLYLTVNHSDTISYNITACESYEWHGQTYSQSGNYTHNTTNEFGCNRLETLELTISDSYRQEDVVTECDRYYWPVNQQWYYESTVDSIMVQGQQGLCDSIFVLRFTKEAGSTSSIQGPILIFPVTDIISGIYQYHLDSTGINPANVHWSIDRDDWLLVPHNASCDLLCLSIGQGILRAWTEGEPCDIDTTLVLNATFFDVGENEQASLKLYPNPTKGKITVEWDEIKVINVYDLLGQKLMVCEYDKEQVCVLDLRHLQHSVYILEIVSSAGRIIRPVVLTQ